MIQRNGKISYACGLDELILSKWPYYLKQSTGLMKSLSKYPGLPQNGLVVKNLPAIQETKRGRFNPWVGKIPWRRKWQPTPLFLLGKSHG